MKKTESECKIKGLEIREIEGARLDPIRSSLNATYVLIGEKTSNNVTTKIEHAHTKAVGISWSKETWDLFRQLLDSMEEDLLPFHFDMTKEKSNATRIIPTGREETDQI